MGLFLGLGITTAIQSSSAVTVMLVGLVNSGIMTIGRSIPVIMGSNIGTTMTAWILTLVGVESDNLFMKLLKKDHAL
jgi:phosphate:Na+ symporter